MKKIAFLSLVCALYWTTPCAFSQSNDEKAINFLDNRLQNMFKILNTKSDSISPTCMESLKKLHDFKDKIIDFKNASDTQKDINLSILRALYSNSIQFCGADVQAFCSRRVEPSIRNICKELQP